MKTYTFEETHPKIDGPWATEPDKAQWIDTVTDLDCLMLRNHVGALCGYVGVQPGHPWYKRHYDELGAWPDVHGGLTFSSLCAEGEGTEEGPYICHIPAPGRPDAVWWLGFDCHHLGDLAPRYLEDDMKDFRLLGDGSYRTFEYVQQQCAHLAFQIQQAGVESKA